MSSLRGSRCAGWTVCAVLTATLALIATCATGAMAAQIEGEEGFSFARAAKLEAQINPQGVGTTCQAQYVSQQAYEHEGWASARTVSCAPEDVGSGSVAEHVLANLEGLSLNSVYEYRFVASGGGTWDGSPRTFTTFGLEAFSFEDMDLGGQGDGQAGGRPYEFVVKYALNTNANLVGNEASDGDLKDMRVALPPGLIGYPTATPRCPQRLEEKEACPSDTQIGQLGVNLLGGRRGEIALKPLFNLVPPKGVAARFGVVINIGVSAYIDSTVRTGTDYGVLSGSFNTTGFARINEVLLRLWGVPSDPLHTPERACPVPHDFYQYGCSFEGPTKPFLRNPTSCVGPLSTLGSIDSYQEPGEFAYESDPLQAMTGCEKVGFAPSIEAVPSTGVADSPAGMSIDLHEAQNEAPEGIANADLRDAMVAFPEGVVVDPSSADGLEGCSEAQAGFTGFKELDSGAEPGVQTAQFTPGAAECPDASKLGTVQIDTPLLEHPVPGAMYLAAPHANPFGSLLAVYLAAYDPVSGVVVKLPGLVQADPRTGALTATFDQNPQLPFEDLKVDLFGGSRAALTTPETCGSYAMSSVLTPWSGGAAAQPVSHPFVVSEAPGGGACAPSEAQAADAPGFEAGMASPIAGSYSPFVLKLTREDGSQRVAGVDVTLPPGLIGRITGLEECPQASIEAAQARSGEGQGSVELADPSCPAGSELGVVHVGVGSGAPMFVTGHAYFAGPYEGAPFSLVIVTPAVAGPFDLGTVVVRAGLFIDPSTAQVTVKSDPLPSILDGIPLDIRSIGVDVDRSDFTLNPTSCAVMAVTGQAQTLAGQSASLSDRFQTGGCTNLPFKPSFAVSASGKVTHLDGTSVSFKLAYPQGALGKEAWLRSAKFEFPKQLSARFGTIQKACPQATFAANPAGCPAPARIGTATVKTQLLPVALTGPVYFVSNGSQKFPEAVFVLQGDGVTVDLHSETFINETTGITSATLPAIPGVPFEEATVTLPAGPYSEFTGIGNLCAPTRTTTVKKKVTVRVKGHRRTVTRSIKRTLPTALVMPTVLIGQNGASISQNTPVTITECPKAGSAGQHKHARKKEKRRKVGSHGGHRVARSKR